MGLPTDCAQLQFSSSELPERDRIPISRERKAPLGLGGSINYDFLSFGMAASRYLAPQGLNSHAPYGPFA
jgi:hypothetical protein